MYFAIDYENVGNNGMKGSEYLSEEDTVEIFFSAAGPTISQGIFENMKNAKCRLLICKLQNQRKNALDFYIATRLGEMIGRGYQESIAIISNDKDFGIVLFDIVYCLFKAYPTFYTACFIECEIWFVCNSIWCSCIDNGFVEFEYSIFAVL